ncbi:hypothetical protein H5410_011382 [Solanum commersonii]|uniref:Uncharacterized protein n=1 Tax=Solanum commersonii TaxID=4109 RepID=A0A9J6AP88_SOLCO|nr:hypothetical protein H5410_011382 [Solanum commersonii]
MDLSNVLYPFIHSYIENASVMNQPQPKVNNYTDATQLVIGPKRSNKIGRPSPRAEQYFTYLGFSEKEWLPLAPFYLDGAANGCIATNNFLTGNTSPRKLALHFLPLDVDSSDNDKGDAALSFDESTLVFDDLVASDSETVDDCIQTSLQECVVHDFPFGLTMEYSD